MSDDVGAALLTFNTIYLEMKPCAVKGFYYHILVLYAESDSVNNPHQGKSILVGAT